MSTTSNCRWVVIDEDCFEQLQQRQTTEHALKTTTPPPSPVSTPLKEPSVEPTPLEKEEKEEPTPTEKEEPVGREEAWVSEALSKSYQREGLKLLDRIQEEQDLEIDTEGHLTIQGTPLVGFNIKDLLRVTCVPSHRGELPLRLQDWLRLKGITKFHNAKANLRPKWQTRYHLRRR